MIDEVRAHVAERALAPVHPAAPVERVIDRVVVDLRRDAEEQIPRQLVGHRVVADQRRGEPRVDVRAVPRESPSPDPGRAGSGAGRGMPCGQ